MNKNKSPQVKSTHKYVFENEPDEEEYALISEIAALAKNAVKPSGEIASYVTTTHIREFVSKEDS